MSGDAPTGAPAPPPGEAKVSITVHREYTSPHMYPSDFVASPFKQFERWLSEAQSPPAGSGMSKVNEPEAVCISTVSKGRIPSSRMVLLRGMDDRGFTFFTNYKSRKSGEMEGGWAGMNFYWREQHRQVRVVGKVEKVERSVSEEYFKGRPRGSQIGAWASPQSQVIGEETMKDRVDELEKEWEGKEVECPLWWGGWRIVPTELEFWSGHSSRLHDRFRYLLEDDGSWKIDRLAP